MLENRQPPATFDVPSLGPLARLEEKIRAVQSDLEEERKLRDLINKERSELYAQIEVLTERHEKELKIPNLDEIQKEINRKCGKELNNLRRLLDESNTEEAQQLSSYYSRLIGSYFDDLTRLSNPQKKSKKNKKKKSGRK